MVEAGEKPRALYKTPSHQITDLKKAKVNKVIIKGNN